MIKVGITGGIGSGKTIVCRFFAALGVPVYYTDDEARRIMHADKAVRNQIIDAFGAGVYDACGQLDRRSLAAVVFGDPLSRVRLEAIVHPAVIADFERWCMRQGDVPYVILESAILFSAGIDRVVDTTLAVLAPEALRIERVVRRDGSSIEDVKRRIAAQMDDDELALRSDHTMVNISKEDTEKNVTDLDRIFRRKASNG